MERVNSCRHLLVTACDTLQMSQSSEVYDPPNGGMKGPATAWLSIAPLAPEGKLHLPPYIFIGKMCLVELLWDTGHEFSA